MPTNRIAHAALRGGLCAVIALAALWSPPAAARLHSCKATYMFGTTRYEFSGTYSSPIFNMVLRDSDIWQGYQPIGVAWDKQLVSSADTAPFASVFYSGVNLSSSIRIDGGEVIFAQPVTAPRLYLEAGGNVYEGMQPASPAAPESSRRLYGSFDAKLLANVRKPFAIIMKDGSGRILYRAKFAGISKKAEAEANAIRQQIARQFDKKPASGSAHPRECT